MNDVKKIKARKIQRNNFILEKSFDNSEKTVINGVQKNKIKGQKIKMSLINSEEKKIDEVMARDDNMSIIIIIIFIIALCFCVGISLGYLLYKIAINGGI